MQRKLLRPWPKILLLDTPKDQGLKLKTIKRDSVIQNACLSLSVPSSRCSADRQRRHIADQVHRPGARPMSSKRQSRSRRDRRDVGLLQGQRILPHLRDQERRRPSADLSHALRSRLPEEAPEVLFQVTRPAGDVFLGDLAVRHPWGGRVPVERGVRKAADPGGGRHLEAVFLAIASRDGIATLRSCLRLEPGWSAIEVVDLLRQEAIHGQIVDGTRRNLRSETKRKASEGKQERE